MRIFLIRHGETEHNVAGLLAGVTDSRLTNHGVLQAQRLGSHLIDQRQLRFSHVFASDLQRAHRTADAICNAQNAINEDAQISTLASPLLREQDFGSYELLPWNRAQFEREPDSTDKDFKPKETPAAMKSRADDFLDNFLLPLLAVDDDPNLNVAVVSHGLFLAALWRALLLRLKPSTVTLKEDIMPPGPGRPLEYLPAWTNTGILELKLTPSGSAAQAAIESKVEEIEVSGTTKSTTFLDATMQICSVNNKDHLLNLKRARGGLGSSAADDKQRKLENFFKKPKPDANG